MFYCSANAQTISLNGQASGWLISQPEKSVVSQLGLRYIPDLLLTETLSGDYYFDTEISINTYLTQDFSAANTDETNFKIKPYRLWARLSSNQYEVRLGLQKINFGSATLFRPLKWFDTIDPRDPLALSEGVYGLLARYYFEDNTNIWLWGLYDNKDLKGWEFIPTKDNSIEFGGRFQTPFLTGEAGLTFHHRKADLSRIPSFSALTNQQYVNENRFAFDGKWDAEIGIWLEAAVIHRDIDVSNLKYQRMITVGADYTFDFGDGLHVLSEFFNTENSNKFLGSGEGKNFAGLSSDYPVGLFDNVSAFYYRDWTNKENYFSFTWQRIYDNWMIYFIGFLNPDNAALNQSQSGNNALAGNGLQIMVVFNH